MEQRRGVLARIGIALLNLLAPGLGLLRVAYWKTGLALFLASTGFLALAILAPPVTFPVFAAAIIAGLAVYVIAIVLSWRASRATEPRPWYSRWYVVVAAGLSAFAISWFLNTPERMRYRGFHTPAEAMAPTLSMGDRFFAYMGVPKDLRRGDLLLVRAPDGSTYIKRLAGLPGDTIGLVNGKVVLNGKTVPQPFVRSDVMAGDAGAEPARRMREQLPGEFGSHEVYDLGESVGDNAGPYQVTRGHVFLLGDNRDRSADSRFSHQEMGLEQVAIEDIIGWPLFYSYGSSRPMGEPINRKGMQ